MTQPNVFAGPRRDDWRTPKWLRGIVIEQYQPRWDLAACAESSLGSEGFFSAEESYLASRGRWTDVAWLNPPFSRAEDFFAHVAQALKQLPCSHLVAIYKANLETATWQKHILPTCSWVFAPARRIAYEPPPGIEDSTPQFASLLVGWNVPVIRGIPGHQLIVKGSQ